MSKASRKAVIAVGGALAIVAAATAALYLSAVFFLIASKVNPRQAALDSFPVYWQAYENDPRLRKRLVGSMVAASVLCFLVVPVTIASAAQKQRSLHGDARFATPAEIEATGLRKGRGILVGKYRGKFLALDGQQFVLLAAPTRTGKGVGVVIPNLLSWPDSVMVLDIKGENFKKTAGFRQRHGQNVYCFRPFDESGCTHRNNPLDRIRRGERHRIGDIQMMAKVFYPTGKEHSGSTDKFFNDKAADLFLALALLVMETPSWPFTLGELLRQSSGRGMPISDYLKSLMAERERDGVALSEECLTAIARFLSNSENTLSSILSTFTAPLALFADPLVDAATSASDFSLADVRKQRMSIYIVIPLSKLPVCSLLVNLLFSQLIDLNTREEAADNPDLRFQCLLLMDEFTSMDRVSVMAKGVAFIASYDLRFLTIFHSEAQLASVYGEQEAKNFITNHALQILYAPRLQSDAEDWSKLLGNATDKSESHGRSRQVMGGKGTTVSTNVSDQKRALLLPQELRELDPEHEIIVMSGCKPIYAEKIRYYDDPVLKDRVLPPPTVPRVDLDLHVARVQGRRRPAAAADVVKGIDLSALAHDFTNVPELSDQPTQKEVTAFVDAFFDSLSVAPVSDDSPNCIEAHLDAVTSTTDGHAESDRRVDDIVSGAVNLRARVDLTLLDVR